MRYMVYILIVSIKLILVNVALTISTSKVKEFRTLRMLCFNIYKPNSCICSLAKNPKEKEERQASMCKSQLCTFFRHSPCSSVSYQNAERTLARICSGVDFL